MIKFEFDKNRVKRWVARFQSFHPSNDPTVCLKLRDQMRLVVISEQSSSSLLGHRRRTLPELPGEWCGGGSAASAVNDDDLSQSLEEEEETEDIGLAQETFARVS